jgi:aspartate aminotransferase
MGKLASRMSSFNESQTLAMARKSRELQAQGIDVISLSIGEPDFDTPDFIKASAKKAIDDGYTKYTPVAGVADLRKAVSEKFKRDNNLTYKPEQIVISTGAKQSIANAVLALVDVGDEVIIPTPTWVSYVEIVKLAGGVPVYINTNIEQDFKFTAVQLQAVITPKSKLVIFSSPCNPTGSVYESDELQAIANVIASHEELYVMSDEIYEHINFTGQHTSMASFANVYDRTITVNGVSKGFAMTGWRIGYMGAPLWIAQACEKMQGQFTSGACSVAQMAAITAVLANPDVTKDMCIAFERRRDLMIKLLSQVPGFKINKPQGAFYIFPDVTHYYGKKIDDFEITNSSDLCMFLLHRAHVALVSGDAFGDDRYVRFSYATSDDKLIESVKRIKEALTILN